MSATPVREALNRPAAERLVAVEPFKGCATRPMLTQRELSDLLDVRALLEAEAARLAARRASRADMRAMQRELAEMDALDPKPCYRSFQPYVLHDQRLHELLVGASGNPILLETFKGLHARDAGWANLTGNGERLMRFYRQRVKGCFECRGA